MLEDEVGFNREDNLFQPSPLLDQNSGANKGSCIVYFSRGWQYITKVDNMHYHTQGMQYLFYYTEPTLIEFIWYLQFYM